MSCRECCCYSCSQRDNCAQNGCEGAGCTSESLDYFKSDCAVRVLDIYVVEDEREDDFDCFTYI